MGGREFSTTAKSDLVNNSGTRGCRLIVFEQHPFSYSCYKDPYSFATAWNPDDHGFHAREGPNRRLASLISHAPSGRRKRRRTKSSKIKEDLKNQRMTHIVVERNRRRQMNDYLTVIHSLMPLSYVWVIIGEFQSI
ncbi:transcription factor bHLH70-like [Prosopis cineraria]|uniref:transcription factor bHLH70-like n=1 Tax=Prosopis cineraria TaxID=364024 RepID=UPI00240F0767|nr:transcription factor bHLH70-like [Prosopis cineraria]